MQAPLRNLGREAHAVAMAESATHFHLRQRLLGVLFVSVILDVVGATAMYLLEHGRAQAGIHTFGDALFWTSAQLLTVSSQMPNPVTTGGKIVDILLEGWAITAVTAVAGSFGAFFHRRGMEKHPLGESAGTTQ